MNKELSRFLIRVLLLTFILIVIGAVFYKFLLSDQYFESFPITFAVFIAVSYISHQSLLKAAKKSDTSFNMAFMLSFVIKLFAYGAYVVAILMSPEENKVSFALCFVVLYFIYTIFDAKQILAALKRIKK